MTLFLWILVAILGFSVLSGFYDAGKYAHGGKDVREGTKWAFICIVAAIIHFVFVMGLLLGW